MSEFAVRENLRNRAMAAVAAGLFLTACTSGTEHEVVPSPVVTTEASPSSAPQIEGMVADEAVYNAGAIDLSGVSAKFKPEDFTHVRSKNPKTGEEQWLNETNSVARFMTIEGGETGLRFSDITPGGMPEATRQSLLGVIEQNKAYIDGALAGGTLDRIVFYTYPQDSKEKAYTSGNGEYLQTEFVDGVEHKSIFYYMTPWEIKQQANQVTDLRHELIHALTANVSASFENQPVSSRDADLYKSLCTDIKRSAFEYVSKHDDRYVADYKKLANTAPVAAQNTLRRLAKTLVNGSFIEEQRRSGEPAYEVSADHEIPECFAENPFRVALRQMHAKGIDTDKMFDYKDTKTSHLVTEVVDKWDVLTGDAPIYKDITESTYAKPTAAKIEGSFGHPTDGWDELVTSTLTVAITYPDQLAARLSKLPVRDRTAVLKLIDTAYTSLAEVNADQPELLATMRQAIARAKTS